MTLSVKTLMHLLNLRNVFLYAEKLAFENIRRRVANLITFASKLINSSAYSYQSMDFFLYV